MPMTIPVIPALPAGYIVTAADLNALGSAATFLLNKPIAHIHDNSGTTTIGTGGNVVTFDTLDFDTDGMYAGTNRLTVQTPGYYKVRYAVTINNFSLNSAAQITTGSNNPLGAGVTTFCWPGYARFGNSLPAKAGASGVLPAYMFAGDYVRVFGWASGSGVQSNDTGGCFLTLELVSI